jgi:Rps23 Pro-64 3,4-dihydroxylase Tpa1-like proline 4-hydroxylase
LIAHLAVMCIKALYPDWVKDAHTWRYSCTYMVYCAGTQLSWHEDGDGHDGVFNYYLDHWEGHWGGELDLIDCDAGLLFATIDPLEVAVLRSPLNATSVFPRANRMTVMHAQTPHRVRRVDPLAGSHLRRAISGSVACLGDSRHDSLH